LVVEDSGVHYNLDPDIFAGISPTCAPILVGYVGAGSQGGRVYHSAGPAATFCTFGGGVGGPTGVYYVGGVTRKLHHRECARAMGFPDSFSFPVSDGIAKQLIGNSVAVLVVRKIFEAMVRAYVGREGGAPTHRSSVELSAVPVVAGVAWAKVKLAGADPGCPLNVVSLFSGCGGLDTGFEQAGFNVVLGTDKWGKAMATYRANHPNSKAVCVDIATEAGKAEICALAEEAGGVDVVIGGPPCKTFSGLNKKRRKDLESDPMSFLFRHYFEVIRRLKPKCFVMENVLPREKRRLRGQRVLDAWLQAAGDCGYRTECRILCASDYGTPQSRKRVIIIGILATSGAPILFPKPSHDEHGRNGLPKWITAKEAIGDLENAPEDINSAHVQFEQSANLLRKISAIKCGGFLGKRGLGYRRLYPDRPAGTIVASSTSRPIHYSLDRLLTPREAARLQGFRDTYHFDATDPRSAYAVIGNAVPVQMARAVAVSVRTMFLKMHEQNQPERSVVPGQAGRALRQAQVSAVPEAAERAA
jgi:DNA (cytosine-5)-methyltransferase 1